MNVKPQGQTAVKSFYDKIGEIKETQKKIKTRINLQLDLILKYIRQGKMLLNR